VSDATWTDVLDALEQRIADQRASLDEGDARPVPAFEPPIGLGPLPEALQDRAALLLAESLDVAAELQGALTFIGQDLAVMRKVTASSGETAGARFLDTSL
jgi:hypothetical protein